MPNIENTFDALSFRYFLLDNYKKLKISEEELCVLLMCDHLIKQGNLFITADILRLKMNLHTQRIDEILVALINKKFIEFTVTSDGMVTSLEPIRKKLFHLFEVELSKDKSSLASNERRKTIEELTQVYEKKLRRSLSPIELDMINSWLDDDFSSSEIQDALSIALRDGKKTFRSIDKRLKDIRTKDDVAKEGYSAMNRNSYSKDIETTLKIANTNWLKDDDK